MIESDGSIQTFGEGVPNPRSYGAFPLVFRKYVRGETRSEAPEDEGMQVLSLEEAVRKMTSFPAQKLGMRDRGMIRESMIADLVIFDPETISDKCTYTDPHQYPVGIPYVIVGGEVVVDQSKHTGLLTGHILESTRSTN
jgi:N-acyl-D-aspartate/D-glutamate deacylase